MTNQLKVLFSAISALEGLIVHNIEASVFPPDGMAGIGTDAPVADLHIHGLDGGHPELIVESWSPEIVLKDDDHRDWSFGSHNNSFYFRIDQDNNGVFDLNDDFPLRIMNGKVGMDMGSNGYPKYPLDLGSVTAIQKLAIYRKSSGGDFYGVGAQNSRLHLSAGKEAGELADVVITNQSRVGIGTTDPVYSLDVNGTIRAEEIIVESSGADYVFEAGYALPTLDEVREHISEKGHLPGIPSAKEMQATGVSLGDLSTLHLAKIEELTLYILQMEEENRALEKKNETLAQRFQLLEEQVRKLSSN